MSQGLERIAAEIVARRQFQTVTGAPERLPDGSTGYPASVSESLLSRHMACENTWRRRIRIAAFRAADEVDPKVKRSLLVSLAAVVAGQIADIDSREPALVPAKDRQQELVGAGVAG